MPLFTPVQSYGSVIAQSAQPVKADTVEIRLLEEYFANNNSLEFIAFFMGTAGAWGYQILINDTSIYDQLTTDAGTDTARGIINFALKNKNTLYILRGEDGDFGTPLYTRTNPSPKEIDIDWSQDNRLKIVANGDGELKAYRLRSCSQVVAVPYLPRDFTPPPPPATFETATFADDYPLGTQPDDWTRIWNLSGTFLVGASALEIDTDGAGRERRVMYWNDKGFENAIAAMRFNVQDAGSTSSTLQVGMAFRAQGAAGNETGYLFVVDHDELLVYRYLNGVSTKLSTASQVLNYTQAAYWWMKAKVSTEGGTTFLRWKLWADGADEPDDYEHELTDDQIPNAGENGIFAYSWNTQPFLVSEYKIAEVPE